MVDLSSAFILTLPDVFFFCRFIDKLKQDIPGKGVKQMLEVLCNVYSLFLLHKYQGDFLATGSITAKQASLATTQLRNLYSQVCLITQYIVMLCYEWNYL